MGPSALWVILVEINRATGECQGEAMGAKRDRLGGYGCYITEFRFDPFLIALVSSQWSLLQSYGGNGRAEANLFSKTDTGKQDIDVQDFNRVMWTSTMKKIAEKMK